MNTSNSKEFEQIYNEQVAAFPDLTREKAYHMAEDIFFARHGVRKYKKHGGYATFRMVRCRRAANELKRKQAQK